MLTRKQIEQLSNPPEGKEDFETWIQQKELTTFLGSTIRSDRILIHALLPHFFLHRVFVPRLEFSVELGEQLDDWQIDVGSSWGVSSSMNDIWIHRPLDNSCNKILETGEMIIVSRHFEGRPSVNKSYYEVNQKLVHVLNLHYMEERNAWCKLDKNGDVMEAIKIEYFDRLSGNGVGKIISMDTELLAEYATLSDYSLVGLFDSTRFRVGSFNGWPDKGPTTRLDDGNSIFGSLTNCSPVGSYSRGAQITNFNVSKAEMISEQWGTDKDDKDYATFIAHDWRHDVVAEFSCDPASLSTYFAPTDNPFEISPAFFRAEVLSKYKADPEKYEIEYRSVTCRGAWHLKAVGFNEAGQVHAYLGYLADLPYEEQLHWKGFNEAPKAPLSESVIKTDFDGEFSTEYDPLMSVKHKLEEATRNMTPWWTLRDPSLPKRVHYPYSDTRADWANEILNLDQFIVEGFEEKYLRKLAKELGRNPPDQLRGLKLLEECLIAKGFEADHARQIMTPFHDIHNLRSELKGHASTTTAANHEKAARKQFGNLLNHYRDLCTRCDESLEIQINALA